MRPISISRTGVLALSLWLFPLVSHAQNASPQQIQALIAQGEESQALAELAPVLQAHPHSGVAWYLTAEAQDAAGNESAASTALGNAEQYSPGLPFANPGDVSALRAHVSGDAAPHHGGLSTVLVVLAILFALFLLGRLFFGRRVGRGAYGGGAYYPGPPGGFGATYGPSGGGFGSSLLGGLAAGAGFAAGERIIDDLSGGNRDLDDIDPNQVAARDDGLTGAPGWDDPSNPGGNFDPGNTW